MFNLLNRLALFLKTSFSKEVFRFIGLFFLILFSLLKVSATTYTTIASGAWGTASNWNLNGVPPSNLSGHTVNILHNMTSGPNLQNSTDLTVATINMSANLTVSQVNPSNGGIFIINEIVNGSLLTVNGNFTLNKGDGHTFGVDIVVNGNMIWENDVVNTQFNGNVTVSGDVNIVTPNGTNNNFNGNLSATNLKVDNDRKIQINGIANISNNVSVQNSGGRILGSGMIFYSTLTFFNGGQIDGGDGSDDAGSCNYDEAAKVAGTIPNPIDLSLCGKVLPIILAYFKVEKIENDFSFDWKTFEELDNDYFELEFSLDGKNFIAFANIDGAGTSYRSLEYNYVESKLSFREDIDLVYFRLKQVDYDGSFDFSPIVPVKLRGSNSFSTTEIYPNPAKDVLTLKLEDWKQNEGFVEVSFINSIGQKIERQIQIESIETTINLSDIPKGMYVINILGLVEAYKLVIQ